MKEPELHILKDLLEETTNFIQSDELLRGVDGDPLQASYMHNGQRIPIKVVAPHYWDSITGQREESTVVDNLDKELEEFESLFYMVNSDSSEVLKKLIRDKNELVRRIAYDSENVKRLGIAMEPFKRKGCEHPLEGLKRSVYAHIASINDMRFVTLGRRIALTEGLFHTYKLGLFPFGWDYESIWCLNPSDLEMESFCDN